MIILNLNPSASVLKIWKAFALVTLFHLNLFWHALKGPVFGTSENQVGTALGVESVSENTNLAVAVPEPSKNS